MVSRVRSPKNVGSLAKVVRRYGATSPACQSCVCSTAGAEDVARDPQRGLAQQREADVIVGIVAVNLRTIVKRRAIHEKIVHAAVDEAMNVHLVGVRTDPQRHGEPDRFGAAAVFAPTRYLGRTTPTSSPKRTSAGGSAPKTSARPPVLAKGVASDATIRIFTARRLPADVFALCRARCGEVFRPR